MKAHFLLKKISQILEVQFVGLCMIKIRSTFIGALQWRNTRGKCVNSPVMKAERGKIFTAGICASRDFRPLILINIGRFQPKNHLWKADIR